MAASYREKFSTLLDRALDSTIPIIDARDIHAPTCGEPDFPLGKHCGAGAHIDEWDVDDAVKRAVKVLEVEFVKLFLHDMNVLADLHREQATENAAARLAVSELVQVARWGEAMWPGVMSPLGPYGSDWRVDVIHQRKGTNLGTVQEKAADPSLQVKLSLTPDNVFFGRVPALSLSGEAANLDNAAELTAREAANFLNVSESYVHRLLRDGEIAGRQDTVGRLGRRFCQQASLVDYKNKRSRR